MVMGRRGLLLSSHPSLHRSCSLLALSLQDGSMGGGMVIWGAVPCCSPLIHCLVMPHRFSYLIGSSLPFVSSSTHPRSRGTDKAKAEETIERERESNETDTTRRHDETRNTRRPTRRWRRRYGGQASNETTDETRYTRRGNETPSDENERTTTKGNWGRAAL